jgi:hypothetical protein
MRAIRDGPSVATSGTVYSRSAEAVMESGSRTTSRSARTRDELVTAQMAPRLTAATVRLADFLAHEKTRSHLQN